MLEALRNWFAALCDKVAAWFRSYSNGTLHHYIIVRADLPRGVQAAHIAHAAGESAPGNLDPGTYAYVLTVPDELTLVLLSDRLFYADIAHKLIAEPCGPYDGSYMAIGINPTPDKVALKKHLSALPLLR